jgi:hypothetical protein
LNCRPADHVLEHVNARCHTRLSLGMPITPRLERQPPTVGSSRAALSMSEDTLDVRSARNRADAPPFPRRFQAFPFGAREPWTQSRQTPGEVGPLPNHPTTRGSTSRWSARPCDTDAGSEAFATAENRQPRNPNGDSVLPSRVP